MINCLRAEWKKLVAHRAAMFSLLGIFPTVALIFILFTSLALKNQATLRLLEDSLSNWQDMAILAWHIPSNFFGRLFLLAFTAFAFASEYQWGTWKNVTVRTTRSKLVLAKFLVTSSLVVLTFVFVSLILALGGTILCRMAGVGTSPSLPDLRLAEFAFDYGLGASLAFLAVLITSIFAAMGAIYSRTVLGGTLMGMIMVFVDPALLYGSRLAAELLGTQSLLHTQRISPYYNIENVRSWMTLDTPTALIADSFTNAMAAVPVDGAVFSLVVLALWVVVGVGLTAWLFECQDITS